MAEAQRRAGPKTGSTGDGTRVTLAHCWAHWRRRFFDIANKAGQRAAELPRKSALTEAIGYALNQWDGLVRRLDDGRFEIDSITVERSRTRCSPGTTMALHTAHLVMG